MLLPIVLLLASAAAQQSDVAVPTQHSAIAQQNRVPAYARLGGVISNPGPNKFLRGKPNHGHSGDEGIVVGRNPCLDDGTCQPVCASIRAHVFSDGENPQPLYVTDCPNLDVPYQTKRAQHTPPKNQQEPALKRTTYF